MRTLVCSTFFWPNGGNKTQICDLAAFGNFTGITPCAKRPESFARARIHLFLSGPQDRAPYSREMPVASSTMALARASDCRIWVVAAIYCPRIDPKGLLRWVARGFIVFSKGESVRSRGIKWGVVFGRAKGVGGGAGFSFAHVYSTLGTGAIRDRGTLGGSTGVDAGGRGILGGGVVVTATAPPRRWYNWGYPYALETRCCWWEDLSSKLSAFETEFTCKGRRWGW